MGQVTLYLDSETKERLRAAAKAEGVSQSRWVADLIREKTATEWPASLVKLIGAWAADFPDLEAIRTGVSEDLSCESF